MLFYQGLKVSEKIIIENIKRMILKYNVDNISRTDAYFRFYKRHPEIIWSFLASMVSRNAGWNMCDLEGVRFSKILNQHTRQQLFLTYERANWLIFQDAFPQLLLYQYSTKVNRPMFHLLKFFHVSAFMKREWQIFWNERDLNRLMFSLIINEQNVIQKPVIEHPVYKRRVFHSLLFSLQDWLHFSSVIFPTCEGELFGASVNGFKSVEKRIDLGKRLADILFSPDLYPKFYKFASRNAHTGSRYDYEKYLKSKTGRDTPFLRCTYPVISHHLHHTSDWSKHVCVKRKWKRADVHHIHPIHLTNWYLKKQKQLHAAAFFKGLL